jgi:Macrocin-O-methyltransferase (TylF)
VKVCLEYYKVAPGGMIQFDDYRYWKGAQRAADEFLDRQRVRTVQQ